MFRRRPRRTGTSIVAGAESSQSDSALDGSRGPRGSAVRGEPTGCLHRQRGREGTLPSGATRRLEPVGRPTLGAVVSSARLRAGVAAAELTVLTPPGHRLSPELNRAVVERERPRSRRSGKRQRNRGAGSRSGVRRQGGQPVPRVGSNKLAGLAGGAASRRGEPSNGARGSRLSPVVQARSVRQQPGDSIILPRCSPRARERESFVTPPRSGYLCVPPPRA